MSKLHTAPASKRNTHRLSASHSFTTDFGQFSIPRQVEVLPSDVFNSVDLTVFSRFDSLAKPTFGKIFNRVVASWTPYHILKQDADAYLAGDKYFNGEPVTAPYVTMNGLHDLMATEDSSTGKCLFVSTDPADGPLFTHMFEGQVTVPRQYFLKPLGRYIYKLLTQLGYDVLDANNYSSITDSQLDYYEAFSLMAFFRSYLDLLSNSQTQNRSLFSRILSLWYKGAVSTVSLPAPFSPGVPVPVAQNVTTDGVRHYVLNPLVLAYLFTQVRILWQDDLYTEAWRYPTSPLGVDSQSIDPSISLKVASTDPQPLFSNTNEYGPTLTDTYGTPTVQPQIWLDALRRWDNFVRRNNYAGSLVTQQLLARFGVNIGDVKHLYAQRIYSNSDTILIGDVTATAGTEQNALGSYAGKAIGSTSAKFSFKSDDPGLITFIHWFTPDVQYVGGIEPSVLRKDFTDHYQPELDGMQANPISFKELVNMRTSYDGKTSSKIVNLTYGWNERYNNYRRLRSRVTGDMVLYPYEKNWVLSRDISASLVQDNVGFAQSDFMLYQPIIGHPCLNIFNVLSNDSDHIKVYTDLDINANRLLLSMSEASGIEQGSVTLEKNGTTNN